MISKRIGVALVAAVLATSSLATAALAVSRERTCKYGDGDGYSRKDVRQEIRCAARHWNVPGGVDKALDVARCESGFTETAYYYGNAGVYQQHVIYWPARHRAYLADVGRHLDARGGVYHARANVLVSVHYAHLHGWSAWSCA